MAFKDLRRSGMDESDMSLWAKDDCAVVFVNEVKSLRDKALRDLLKCKATDHDQYAQEYKAFEKVLTLLAEAADL